MAEASTSKTQNEHEKLDENPAKQDADESSLSKVEHEYIETDSRGQ